MKTKHAILTLCALAMLSATILNPALAGPAPTFYPRTDKASYLPGDTGTLFITIRNQGDQAFTIKNVSITYPWMAFVSDHWEGNETIPNINQAFAPGQTYNTQRGFTIPTDGRAQSGDILVRIGTDIGGGGGSFFPTREPFALPIVIAAATYQPFGLATSALELVTIGLLAVAVIILAMVLVSIRRMAKKP